MNSLAHSILSSPTRLAMPILASPGAQLIGCAVKEIFTDPGRQFEAQAALHKRFATPFVMSAMDLSVEAEEFGSKIRIEGDEVPTVIGRIVCDESDVKALALPEVGSRRTRIYLDVVRRLSQLPDRPPVLGGMIGPFSLAGRLFGVSEALLATATEPETMTLLVEKVTGYLVSYAAAFKAAGARGIIIAEPTAGLMAPASLAEFSSPYVRRIVNEVEDENFSVILHNCGARLAHLPSIRESGATILHFGRPMDIIAALNSVDSETVVCGNLDPAEVFCDATPAGVAAKVAGLLGAAGGRKNFVISSGCDIPAQCSIGNLEAFFSAVGKG